MMFQNESHLVFIINDINLIHTTEKKIQGFLNLEDGWSYGEGVAFEPSILNVAISLNQAAIESGFYKTDAFPGLSGEVMVTIYYRNHYLEFTLEPDGSITYYHEQDDEEIYYQEGLSFEDAKSTLEEFRERIWREFESSTGNIIMIPRRGDLTASHSEIPQEITLESQSLAESVYSNLGELFVNISGSTTQAPQAIPQFFGASLQTYYRPVTG